MQIEQIAAASITGVRRGRNEDRHAWVADGRIIVLADGLAGRPHGDLASSLAVQGAVATTTSLRLTGPSVARLDEEDAVHHVRTMFRDARMAVIGGAARPDVSPSMFSTLLVALVTDLRIIVGHVGDSRCYRIRDGALTQLTTDHRRRPLGIDDLDASELRELQSLVCLPERGVGAGFDAEPDVVVDVPRAGDMWLLCTNGLSDAVPEALLALAARESVDAPELAGRLVFMARREQAEDDATAVVVQSGRPGVRAHASPWVGP